MINKVCRSIVRKRKHVRVRKKVNGTAECPRLNVYRSLKGIYAQIIDDTKGATLISASTLSEAIKTKLVSKGNKEAAREVGKLIAQKALQEGIEKVVFDRGGYIYHGRVKELADGAREGGLKF